MTDVIANLHASLDSRLRPEDVAKLILDGLGDHFDAGQRHLLQRAANARAPWWYTSMSTDFERPSGAAHQIDVLARLAGVGDINPDDPASVRAAVARAGIPVGWTPGVKYIDRMTRTELKASGSGLSKRQYNRLLRHLRRTTDKADRMAVEQRKRRHMLVGRSGLAHTIPLDQFRNDPAAACFVAYFAARRNARREFTLSGKTNPYDEIADMLFQRLDGDSDWAMVARAYPRPHAVSRLTPVERGELLGLWWAQMRDTASLLAEVWEPAVDRTKMIVRQGMDSSTWNTTAQAYNTARAGWLAVVATMGAESLLDVACPGKVMRLMAAGLVYWHRSSGSGVDPDTAVWAALPLPWQVMSGEAACTRQQITDACRKAGLDPSTKGWTAPRETGKVARFKPTPELVHGVSIADPTWAALLRNAGVFSGKKLKDRYSGDFGAGLPDGVVLSDLPVETVVGS